MNAITEKVTIYSEEGNHEQPSEIKIIMDGTMPGCPVTFYNASGALFSMGVDEIDDFIKALKALDCNK